MHARSYFGEFDAGPVTEWLNSKARAAGDPVEELIELNAWLPFRATELDIRSCLAKHVSRSKLAVAPVLVGASPNRWQVDWRLVEKVRLRPLQALALIKLLHLGDKGLLSRVRKCGKRECGEWFYARFEHQRFHSKRCQQEAFRSDPEWKKHRAEYMKQLRQDKKLRERKWLRAAKRRGKR
jgi:hypothetical protein